MEGQGLKERGCRSPQFLEGTGTPVGIRGKHPRLGAPCPHSALGRKALQVPVSGECGSPGCQLAARAVPAVPTHGPGAADFVGSGRENRGLTQTPLASVEMSWPDPSRHLQPLTRITSVSGQ